ncbi:uncharacterized protein DSM5745_06433 [Aspergillus mulundensis]|uniref:Uncharacterized protein n=1 Tax=Aspergillus mulundensis TaxID=1810919 RepID=A0A3D8RRL9_9EURO|nr:Uncharacterized protein DSM5745_06433 [Aspergillus mulundensis]RDW76441.1 Uncharacterized protein DSM5745_06433 [Aspergillus mulundensis]
MVQLQHSFLALACLASQLALAVPQDSSSTASVLEQRQWHPPNDQWIFRTCPKQAEKCSDCGGDSRKKGFCNTGKPFESRYQYLQCLKQHPDGGCGLICPCIAEETGEPGTGLPPIIPFPPPPVGFVVPPAAVPSPKQVCNEDYTQTSCKDCEPLEGWCTKGDHAGCPCREECPADNDNKKPSCLAEDCKGENGSCTVGHYKGCKCGAKCPDPEKEVLICSTDACKGKENKCTTDTYNGCKCSTLTSDIYTLYSKAQVQEAEKIVTTLIEDMKRFDREQQAETNPDVTCVSRDYGKALPVDASLLNKLADKFCSGDTSKERSQDLTAKDASSSSYEDYKFHFEVNPGNDCKADCKAAFKSMTGTCQGIDSHSIQASASAKTSCGTEFTYKITKADTFTQSGLQERACHDRDQFGKHGDVRGGELSMSAISCTSVGDDRGIMRAGSDPIKLVHTYSGTQYRYTISWVENCKGDEIDVRYPRGGEHILGNSCWMLLTDNWEKCNNGGAGGYIDYGCVRYDFRPTHD